jgi:hypothetical protein
MSAGDRFVLALVFAIFLFGFMPPFFGIWRLVEAVAVALGLA